MANELHEKIGIPIEKGLLKNRIKTLKHNFYECYDLFNCRSGFAWSPGTKMWTAKPELWKALAKIREKRKRAKRGQLGCSIGGRVFDGIPLQEVVGA
ncbi:hypothetical protein Gorai_012185, partial [Gossypium raimondii]|nr:hypothetical protein [Gossypium raimondii]